MENEAVTVPVTGLGIITLIRGNNKNIADRHKIDYYIILHESTKGRKENKRMGTISESAAREIADYINDNNIKT